MNNLDEALQLSENLRKEIKEQMEEYNKKLLHLNKVIEAIKRLKEIQPKEEYVTN